MSVYNGEKYLRQAVDSILNQSFKNFEFIIIEDCSTDNTLKILKEYQVADSRIILIQKNENKGFKGFVENLNIGLNTARGKYIARMDADDISLPHRLEKQYEFLEKNPDIFMTGAALEFIDVDNHFLKILPAPASHKKITQKMNMENGLYHPVIFFRNNTSVRYREKMFGCEDFDFYLQHLSQKMKFANLTEILLQYRIITDSISRKGNPFFKKMFMEKAKYFFLERQKTRKDSYQNFKEEHFHNMLNADFQKTKEELIFAANVALLYNLNAELKNINAQLKRLNFNDFWLTLNNNPNIQKITSYFLQKKMSKFGKIG
jgi:glycosyltransferase involved in cell wall biosynthesis